ncbi:MAG: hypothetical protein DI598_17260, partial [Pseudopedobacter saltans]
DDGKVDASTRKKLIETHYAPLKEGVNEGFHKEIVKVEYGTPNYEFLKQLQTNAACFAAFKAHAQINEMTALVTNENGKVRSKAEFKQKAWELDANYRGAHLDVEYDTCVRNARSAAQWQKAQSTKRLYPNIKYIASKSAHPRNAHQPFYGLIRPIDDPIWNSILPINAWGCKCSWMVTGEDVTDIPSNLPTPDPAFAFNPGKTGQVFDLGKSDYIKSVSPKDQPKLIKEAKQLIVQDEAVNAQPVSLYTSKNTGKEVTAHPMSIKNTDFDIALETSRDLSNQKILLSDIYISPIVNNPDLRPLLLPNVKGKSNPDFIIENKYMDLKVPVEAKASKDKIGNLFSDAHKQGDGIVLRIDKPDYISEQDLYRQINGKMVREDYANFIIYIKYKEKWKRWDQKTWKQFHDKFKESMEKENPE